MFKGALITALAGILLLLIIAEKTRPEPIRVCGITEDVNGKLVSAEGYAGAVRKLSSGGSSLSLVENKCEARVVFFEKGLIVNKGDKIKVVGVVQSYKGEIELIADRMEYA